MSRTYKILISVLVACVIGLGGFIGGFFVSSSMNKLRSVGYEQTSDIVKNTGMMGQVQTSTKKLELGNTVSAVYQLMKDSAYEVPSETTATAGAINGILQSTGDTHSRYMPAKEFTVYSEEIDGRFGGIGVVMSEKDGTAYVVEVYKGTPADKAGIKSGDIFYKIAGKTADKWTTQQVQKLVKGKEGTKVTLTMIRPKNTEAKIASLKTVEGKKITVTCTRAMITVPNVRATMKAGKVGYIRLGEFNNLASKQVGDAIKKLQKQGAKSLVLDLRENPGGLIKEAVNTASLFVDKGVIVKTRSRNKESNESFMATGKKVTSLPLVVLIDKNSASASEIVSGALQDYKRATLVGTKSYGKGSVQAQYPLTDGSAILLTVQHYVTPKNQDINGKGLTPDILVKMDPMKQQNAKTDIQLQRALKEAQKKAK